MSHRFQVTVTSDLVLRIIVSRAHLLHSLRQELQIWFVDASRDGGVLRTDFWVTVALISDLVFRIIMSRAYLLYK